MAFENQWHCKEYITEKVWNNGFRAETVPVVWGAKKKDYEAILPPESFIYAEDYTPEELVKYLQYLDKNVTAYSEYFNWRSMGAGCMPDHNREYSFCQLCRIMHGINIDNIFNPLYQEKYSSLPHFVAPNSTMRTVHSIKHFFYETENPECH